jgi:hypothetical protein
MLPQEACGRDATVASQTDDDDGPLWVQIGRGKMTGETGQRHIDRARDVTALIFKRSAYIDNLGRPVGQFSRQRLGSYLGDATKRPPPGELHRYSL